MIKNKNAAIVLKLIKELDSIGSWCGETHVQKTMFFLQEAIKVDTGFEFIMYKHGPYSFDLSDLLVSLQAHGMVRLVPQLYPYGPSFDLSEDGENMIKWNLAEMESEISKIEYIARKLGRKKVVELERLGTALYVRNEIGDGSIDLMADRIIKLKPHIPPEKAKEAIKDIFEIIQ